ncbi:murein biosynthesis integral membrane protein MurJ [Sedimentibacter sp.]|uniref:murein biosynthesis integral membrane protein MurJ n=1 Tax=Sedimentibacter sp. TaxID=1960295 RepID=UPI00289991B5|nr:murein biosynthesis integral membrane protein MurJ [Sedimentibacter sp.]
MKRITLLLIIITIFSKVIGFVRELTLAYFYGASSISDAYIIALTIPSIIFSFIGNAIATGYIPIYNSIQENKSTDAADMYTNNLINILAVLSFTVICFGLVFSEQIVKLFAYGFDDMTLSIATNFTRVSMLGIFFIGTIYIFKSYLQINKNYIIPGLIGLPMNITMIISMYASSKGNLIILGFGILLSTIAQFMFLLPFVKFKGFKYRMVINFKEPNIKRMIHLGLPVIIGVAVNDINKIVDKTLASQISSGGISALNYANQLNSFVQGIIVASIATAMYPLISKMVVQNNMKGLKKSLTEAINYTVILLVPASIGAMTLSHPIVEVLFGRGAFSEEAIIATSNCLFFYSIGMVGMGFWEILSRPFYAIQETRIPMIIASIGVLANIILNLILSKYYGINGLAIATSISAIFISCLMFISLRKKIGSFGLKTISITFIKVLFASIIMAILVKISYKFILASSQIAALFISIVVGLIVYVIIICLMKIEDVSELLYKIKKRILF